MLYREQRMAILQSFHVDLHFNTVQKTNPFLTRFPQHLSVFVATNFSYMPEGSKVCQMEGCTWERIPSISPISAGPEWSLWSHVLAMLPMFLVQS